MAGLKRCTKCKKRKPLSAYGKDKKAKDGHKWQCYECINKHERGVYAKNPGYDLRKSRKGNYKRLYNMTIKEYDQILKKQNYGCAICGETNLDGRRLAIDHDHKTGKVRGLLCQRCNGFIVGYMEKHYELINKSVKYLSKF